MRGLGGRVFNSKVHISIPFSSDDLHFQSICPGSIRCPSRRKQYYSRLCTRAQLQGGPGSIWAWIVPRDILLELDKGAGRLPDSGDSDAEGPGGGHAVSVGSSLGHRRGLPTGPKREGVPKGPPQKFRDDRPRCRPPPPTPSRRLPRPRPPAQVARRGACAPFSCP